MRVGGGCLIVNNTPTIRVRIPLSAVFYVKMLFDKNKNMQKEVVGVGPLKLFVRVCCFGCIATRESCLQVEVTEVIRSLEALLSS